MTEFQYELFIILHLLGFVYWLGGDVGVFYSSGFVINDRLSNQTRRTAAKIMMNLDLIPRICMTLMLTIGATLADLQGLPHYPGQMIALWLLAPFWLGMVLIMHFREGTDLAKNLGKVDYWLRRFLVAAIIVSVAYTVYTGRLAETPWLTAKVGLFAFLIFCGIMIRVHLPDFIAGLRAIATGDEHGDISQEDNLKMAAALKRARPWVLSIWAVVFLEAVLGVAKPGNMAMLQFAGLL